MTPAPDDIEGGEHAAVMGSGTWEHWLAARLPVQITDLIHSVGSLVSLHHPAHNELSSIWLFMCDWTLSDDAGQIASSDDLFDAAMVERLRDRMIGCWVERITFVDCDVTIECRNGLSFLLSANIDEYGHDGDMVVFFTTTTRPIGFSPSRRLWEEDPQAQSFDSR